MIYKSETSKYLDDMTGEEYQLCNVNAKTLITKACQQNKHAHRQDRKQYTAQLSLAHSVKTVSFRSIGHFPGGPG